MRKIITWILALAMFCGSFFINAAADEAVLLRTSEQGIQFIKSQEGFSATRHWDHSQYTIGYGTACGAGEYPNGITVEQAEQLLRESLVKIENNVNTFVTKNNLPLSDFQYDALVSFTFNVGSSWMYGSRLSRLLIGGQFTETEFASAMGVWCHTNSKVSDGLVLRRIREVQMFLYGDYTGKASKQYHYIQFDAAGGSMDADIYYYPAGTVYGSLQTAKRDKMEFLGWFTEDGVQLTDSMAADQNYSVVARWKSILQPGQVFIDVLPSDWFFNCVNTLYNNQVISGYSDGTFRPAGTVTVGEALKLILLACGHEPQKAVDAHWASGYRNLAAAKGYLSAEEMKNLDAPVSRITVAKLAAGAMGLSGAAQGEPVFADTSDAYAVALYHAGVLQGSQDAAGNRYFYPENSLVRSEISAIVYRIQNK